MTDEEAIERAAIALASRQAQEWEAIPLALQKIYIANVRAILAPHLAEAAELRAEIERLRDMPWQPIETAVEDESITIWVFAPGVEGLPDLLVPCRWHADGGFCVDELREPTHWAPYHPPIALQPKEPG